MTENKRYRSASLEAKQSESISGYALVFGQRAVLYKDPDTGLEYGEVIDRHALDGADLTDVVLKYNHEDHVLARTRNHSLSLSIDDHGLKIEADMSGSDEAKSILNDVRSGLLDKMSFAFVVAPDGEQWDAATRTRTVMKIERVFDVAVVDFPAYEQTEVSARSGFQALAEYDRRTCKVQKLHDELRAIAEENNLQDEIQAVAEGKNLNASDFHNGFGSPDDQELTTQNKKILIAKRFLDWERSLDQTPDNLSGAQTFATDWKSEVEQMHQMEIEDRKRRCEIREAVANGAGTAMQTPWNPSGKPWGQTENFRSNNVTDYGRNKNMKNIETRNFYCNMLEKRAAGTTGTMATMIPDTILDNYVIENAPGAFLNDSQVTAISHSGDLAIPIATLQDIAVHEENAEIEANGYVPKKLIIHHSEYAYNVGYSRSGVVLSVNSFMNIVSSTLMNSMLKKMDGICYDGVAGLTYDTQNSVTVTSVPAFDDFVATAAKLGTDYISKAKWYLNSATYFNWVLNLKDNNKKPVFDPTKKIEEQALLGYPLAIDSHIPENTLYFGDGSRIHLNYADPMKIILWTDYDHNTEKAGVNTVAGAAVETGSFVRLSK